MTCIASYKTKMAFKKAVDDSLQTLITDPSIVDYYHGRIDTHPALQVDGGYITVTNHPRRSWFAKVKRVGTELKVT